MRHILADPLLLWPVPLRSVDGDSLLLWVVTKTKVISRSQRDLQRAVVYEPSLKSYLSMKHFSFERDWFIWGRNLASGDVWCGLTPGACNGLLRGSLLTLIKMAAGKRTAPAIQSKLVTKKPAPHSVSWLPINDWSPVLELVCTFNYFKSWHCLPHSKSVMKLL